MPVRMAELGKVIPCPKRAAARVAVGFQAVPDREVGEELGVPILGHVLHPATVHLLLHSKGLRR